jgi:cytochrome c oxidase subunit 1
MIYQAYEKALSSPSAKAELRGWAGLAIGSLAIAGVFAFVVAGSRAPGIEKHAPWLVAHFHEALVIHVIFSFVVWFLAVMGALWQLATLQLSNGTPKLESLGNAGWIMGWIACAFLAAPTLLDRGTASLNNYVPVIMDPLYYVGLMILAVGFALAAIRLIANAKGRAGVMDTTSFAAVISAFIYLLSLACFAIAYGLQLEEPISEAFNEDLFWGGGHVLQFANTALLLSTWYILGNIAFKGPIVSDRVHRTASLLLLLFAIFAPAIYGAFDTFSQDQAQAFTDLQYGHGPSAFLMGVACLAGMLGKKGSDFSWTDPAFVALTFSILVFGVGGVFGLFADGVDTRTPGHYHGMIGGIEIAYMGLLYAVFLPLLGRGVRRRWLINASIIVYALGQLLQSSGLFIAGTQGTVRKAAGAQQGLDNALAKLGMTLNYQGGGIAILGGILFIILCGHALLRKTQK